MTTPLPDNDLTPEELAEDVERAIEYQIDSDNYISGPINDIERIGNVIKINTWGDGSFRVTVERW